MINVIGLGYIGLPTALMMASHGVEVIGTDYNKELVATLNAGKTTFKEDGLDELFQEALAKGIKFTTEYQKTDMYIVSVPTPYDKFSKKVDACYVVAAVKDVMKVCPKGATVVVESTVSPGTIDKFVRPVIEANGFKIGEDINLVHAPERIIPGNMVYELLHNNRTIGADNKEIGEKVKKYYASFCQGEIVVTDIRTAEMTKVVENTYRAVNIAFANELSRICRHDNMVIYVVTNDSLKSVWCGWEIGFADCDKGVKDVAILAIKPNNGRWKKHEYLQQYPWIYYDTEEHLFMVAKPGGERVQLYEWLNERKEAI